MVALSTLAETRVGARYYNCCELQPAEVPDNDKFSQLVSYLVDSVSVSLLNICFAFQSKSEREFAVV